MSRRHLRVAIVVAALTVLSLVAAAPGFAVLGVPIATTTTTGSPMPAFSWTAVNGAVKYEFQITDSAFNPPRYTITTRNTRATLTIAEKDGNWQWRVRGIDSAGNPVPCAWRFPGVWAALAGAFFVHRLLTVQSGGSETRRVDWAQSSAMLVRRSAAAEVGYLDPDFFVYYDECDFCRRLRDAGHPTLYVPQARAKHHDQLSTDLAAGLPRIVEFHRNRELFMRKHSNVAAALAVRLLTAWAYGVRAVIAGLRRRPEAPIFRAHARQALFPNRGVSLRDRAKGTRRQGPRRSPAGPR